MIHTIKKLVATGFVHVFGANTFCKIISFVSGLILVRLLSKSDYGVYSYAFNIFTFFTLISGFGLTSGYLQLGSEYGESQEEKSLFQYCVNSAVVINVLIGFIIVTISHFVTLPIKGSNELLCSMSFLIIPILLSDLQMTRLRTLLRTQKYAVANVLNAIIVLLGSVMGAILFQSLGLIVGRYIAYITLVFVFVYVFRVGLRVTKEKLLPNIKKTLWKVSLISMVNNGLSSLLILLEIFILGILIKDESVVASYKVATTIPFALDFIPQAFVIYIYPYFARNREDKKWVRKNYKKVLLGIGALSTCISVILVVFAPFIIEILFGKEYLDSVNCFRLLSIAFAVGGTFRVIGGNVLVTQRELKFNFVVAIIGTIVNIVSNLVLITNMGAVGAAYAHLIIVGVTGIINTSGVFYYTRTNKG